MLFDPTKWLFESYRCALLAQSVALPFWEAYWQVLGGAGRGLNDGAVTAPATLVRLPLPTTGTHPITCPDSDPAALPLHGANSNP